MTINKQALREEFQFMQDNYSDPADHDRQVIYIAAEALLDELEAKDSTIAAQQHEIRMLLNAIEEKPCPKCNDTGMADSGGTQPWGEPIEIECDCRQRDANTAELVATGIITKVGE
ncbi:hypothetical protein ACK8QK_12855 [Citrobacter portucalensis]|uniref:Ead/Ea22-like family protein n=2 Tax=Citrobacter freundii complex TaxID=1344959 RepID=A0A9X4GSN7_9ENTR|nr:MULTISPECIES: hypothetical protein [Citrobacter]MDE9621658.1 hypothetical protein [Citrobacter portucalensis]